MSIRLPRPVVRLLARGVVAPILSSRVPIPVQRRLLDVAGLVVPAPRCWRSAGALGGVPAVRVNARGSAGPHQVLYLHGGGYLDGSPTAYRAPAAHLSRAVGAPVHALHYRLSPEHPYPAAVDDALAAYRALRAAGHEEQRIAVVGDSAGGGLALTMVLRLRDAGEAMPGAVGLISPWLDLDLRSPAATANARRDAMLNPAWLAAAASAYRAGSDHPELRLLDADLTGLPPLHVVAGADEMLVGDADTVVERARAAGVDRDLPPGRPDVARLPGVRRAPARGGRRHDRARYRDAPRHLLTPGPPPARQNGIARARCRSQPGRTASRGLDAVRCGRAGHDGRGRTPPRESGIRPRPGRTSECYL